MYLGVMAGAAAAILKSVVNNKAKPSLHSSDDGRDSERIWDLTELVVPGELPTDFRLTSAWGKTAA